MLLQVYFTQDGKEYVTPEQVDNEIKDELMQHGGKLAVLSLPPLLNLDLSHIEARVGEMLKRGRRLTLVNGELMTKYMMRPSSLSHWIRFETHLKLSPDNTWTALLKK